MFSKKIRFVPRPPMLWCAEGTTFYEILSDVHFVFLRLSVWPEFGIKSSPTFSKVANIDTSVFYRKKSLDIWATLDRKFVDMNFRKSPNLVTLLPTTIVIIKELLLLWSMLYTFYQRKYRFGQIKTVSSDAWICIKYQAVVSLNQSGNWKILTAFETVLPS